MTDVEVNGLPKRVGQICQLYDERMEDEDVVDDDEEEEEEEEEEAHIDHRSGWHKMPLCCLPIYTRNSRNYLWYAGLYEVNIIFTFL
ncbi:hypothetical protein BLOT_006085 [Blomia tropicalis]|nr:hypothetical protein BLOT_006085 [Blomia tropicalis]